MNGSGQQVWVRRDVAAGAITLAGAMLLVATAGPAMFTAMRGFVPLDGTLAVSVILNVALVLFSWRLHVGLRQETGRRKAAEERIGQLTREGALTGLGEIGGGGVVQVAASPTVRLSWRMPRVSFARATSVDARPRCCCSTSTISRRSTK